MTSNLPGLSLRLRALFTGLALCALFSPGRAAEKAGANPLLFQWNQGKDHFPKTLKMGNYRIRLTRPYKEEDDDTPMAVDVDYPGLPHLRFLTEESNIPAPSLQVVRFDPKAGQPALVVASYTGGAHCCTVIDIYQPQDGAWKHVQSKDHDGEPEEYLPLMDLNGDGTPDLRLPKGEFFYAFDSYAGSPAPSDYYDLLDGVLVNRFNDPSFDPAIRDEMTDFLGGCLFHGNGPCAAFVATAARLGLKDWAWKIMLANYDPGDPVYVRCKVKTKGQCPGDKVEQVPYPRLLERFLVANHYLPAAHAPDPLHPGFDCAPGQNAVHRAICADAALAASDRMVAALTEMLQRSARDSDMTAKIMRKPGDGAFARAKAEQLAWERRRDRGPATSARLTALYAARIAALRQRAKIADKPDPPQNPPRTWNVD